MVLVNLCLREGSFLWTTISVNLLLYVFKRSSTYFSVTNLNNVVKWSASMLREWSKKCSWLWSNTAEPNCSTTALWIAALRFLSKQMPFLCSITLHWKMTDTFFFKCTISCFDLFGSNSDWQAYRCSFAILLGVGGSTILRFLGDLRFGFGETCKCWGNFGKMLGTALGFNFCLPKPLIGWKLSGVKWSLQMYMSFFGFQLSRRIALIHFVNRSGLFTGILWKEWPDPVFHLLVQP